MGVTLGRCIRGCYRRGVYTTTTTTNNKRGFLKRPSTAQGDTKGHVAQ